MPEPACQWQCVSLVRYSTLSTDGATPLFAAVETGHEAVGGQLLSTGANANKARTTGEFTPLSIATDTRDNLRVVSPIPKDSVGFTVYKDTTWGIAALFVWEFIGTILITRSSTVILR